MQNEKQTIFCWLLNNILKHCASHKKLSDDSDSILSHPKNENNTSTINEQ